VCETFTISKETYFVCEYAEQVELNARWLWALVLRKIRVSVFALKLNTQKL